MTAPNADSVFDHVVWDLTRPDATGPHFGPMTSQDADRWRGKRNFFVQKLGQQIDGVRSGRVTATTTRRRGRGDVTVGATRVLLRFVDGLIVDPARCPRRIQSYPHWRPDPTPAAPGQPNARCTCGEVDA